MNHKGAQEGAFGDMTMFFILIVVNSQQMNIRQNIQLYNSYVFNSLHVNYISIKC